MSNLFSKTSPTGLNQLEGFLLQNLNNALEINGETSYTNSFMIQKARNDLGFIYIPNLPVSYALDGKLYFKIASIAAGVLYPYKTLLSQNNAYFIPLNMDDPNTARALFFPWIDGIPTRHKIDDIEAFIKENVSQQCIPIMKNNISLNMDDIVHMAVSGSSGSGKSFFVEYLIRSLYSFTKDITLIDPKMADIYVLGQELGLSAHSPSYGSNLNSFISQVNEVLGRVIDKIYQRQKHLLGQPNTRFERCYVVIDELLALVQGSSKQARETFAQLLGTIALLGRATSVSLLLVSQRFDSVAFGGNTAVREQINCSVILGEINTNTTQFLLPNAHIDNIVIPSGVGTGIIKFNDGKHTNQIIPLLTPTYRKKVKHD